MKSEGEIKLQQNASRQVFIRPFLFSVMFPIALRFISVGFYTVSYIYYIWADYTK